MQIGRLLLIIRKMSQTIPQVPNADIDASGVFKYILMKLTVPDSDGKNENKFIVRGYAECPYHSDIYDKTTSELQAFKADSIIKDWRLKVLGGGRIQHDPDEKKLNVYGYSQGYGKADHTVTVDVLKKVYPDYDITWSDEGY